MAFFDPFGPRKDSSEDTLSSEERERMVKEKLMEMKQKKDVENLISVLTNDTNELARRKAASILGIMYDNRAVDPLIQALKDEHYDVRCAAGWALINLMGPKALDPLLEPLRDNDWRIRASAVYSIASMAYYEYTLMLITGENYARPLKDKAVEPLTQAAAKDEHKEVYREASKALDYIKDLSEGPYSERCYNQELTKLYDWLDSMKEDDFEGLLRVMKHGTSLARSKVVEILEEIKDQRALEALIQTLRDEDFLIQEAAGASLVRIVGLGALDPLIEALRDENWVVRTSAAESLSFMASKGKAKKSLKDIPFTQIPMIGGYANQMGGAVEPLIQALKDDYWQVRESAAGALNRLGWRPENDTEKVYYFLAEKEWHILAKMGAVAIPALIQALKDEDRDIRTKAAWTLGEIGDVIAVEPLTQALNDNYYNSITHVQALEKIAMKDIDPSIGVKILDSFIQALGDFKAVELLKPALKNYYKNIRKKIIEILGRMGGVRAVGPLIDALKDDDKDVRYEVARSLGSIGDGRAVKPLIEALNDENNDVRKRVIETLGDLKDKMAVPPLIKALKDKDINIRKCAAEALGKLEDKKATRPLIRTLKDEDDAVRESAAIALGLIGDERAVEPLTQLLKDEVDSVGWAAKEALSDIADKKRSK